MNWKKVGNVYISENFTIEKSAVRSWNVWSKEIGGALRWVGLYTTLEGAKLALEAKIRIDTR